MSRPSHGGPKLPSTLLDSLSSAASDGTSRSRSHRHGQPIARKEQRKAVRVEKKQQRKQPHRPLDTRAPNKSNLNVSHELPKHLRTAPGHSKVQSKPTQQIKSILKSTWSGAVQSASPDPTKTPPVPRAVKAKLNEDDAEIAALEKKLGLKNKKGSRKASGGDDFEALLDDLDDYADDVSGKRKCSDYDDFLASKRRHVRGSDGSEDETELGSEDSHVSSEVEDVFSNDETIHGQKSSNHSDVDDDVDETEDEFGGFDEDMSDDLDDIDIEAFEKSDTEKVQQPQRKQRENPYVAPMAANASPAGKYVPPSIRMQISSGTEDLTVLRRQLQGLLNRVSEANLISILRDIEKAYASNARQHVTTILIDLLMGLLCDRSALMDTFIILHAGFAAATYRVVGSHFGAQLLERIVADFERLYGAEKMATSGSKEVINLMALLAELYTFQLAGSNVVFDYIRLFLADLSELNTELLLKIIKNCGSQLRHDDPSSLKDIVILLQKSVAKVGEASLPVRTKFMIETINDLKNNRQKTGVAATSVATEHTARLKKTLGSLNLQAKATEPLGVSLADIKSSSKEGKWWLVGASWKNEVQKSTAGTSIGGDTSSNGQCEADVDGEDGVADLLALAKQQRMNTDIRTAIFMNIMSASDFKDAHARLIKLKLKKAQELEIPRVLIHCAGSEQSYNPYYTLIAKQLCTEHRFKWAMQYGLWDLFKRMGEKSNAGEESDSDLDTEEDENIDLERIVNLGRMYGQLIADNAQSLASLKVLNFAHLQAMTKSFLEIVLSTAFKQLSKRSKDTASDQSTFDSAITGMLMRAKDTPQVITGLQYFVSKEANLEEIASSSSERKVLRKASKTAVLILTQLSTSLS